MRVRLPVAVFVAVLTCSAALPAAAAPIIFLSPSSTTVDVGDTFSVDVNVADIDDLFGFQFDFIFDDSLLNPVGITEGSFLSQGVGGSTLFAPGTDNGAGTIEFTLGFLLGPVPGVSGSGTLATLAFAATGSGTAAFSLGGLILQDSQFAELQDSAEINGASVNINASATPIPEPTSLLLIGTGLGIIARRRLRRPCP